ncbi:MAG: DoxX family protein [Cyanophyceae cyanobacterium]
MEYVALAARICLCLIFFQTGVSKVLAFEEDVQMLTQQGLPLANVLLAGAVAFELLGAASLLLGYRVKVGSVLLILFLIPATLVFHNPIADPSQLIDFLKNLGLIGGLLMLIYAGPGALRIDDRSSADKRTRRINSQ